MLPSEGVPVHVVEDDAAMRDALELLLGAAGLAVHGHTCAEQFLARIDLAQPVCLVTDIRLPGMDGRALFRHLVRTGNDPAVVMITGHGDIPMAVAALKEGVVDFIEKPFDPRVLLESIREALRRTEASRERQVSVLAARQRLKSLTPREEEILSLLLEGHPNKVIGHRLGISIRTAEHHRARIMEKLEARTLSHLVRTVLEAGSQTAGGESFRSPPAVQSAPDAA